MQSATQSDTPSRAPRIFLVEDNPADVRLTRVAFAELGIAPHLYVASDGEQALAMLRRHGEHANVPEPDLMLLDLNLPRKDGREVLAEIKSDPKLNHIPVVVLSTSRAERDVLRCYSLQVNCYLQKPTDFDTFVEMIRSVHNFWFRFASLPSGLSALATVTPAP